jgi:hypothetical protein
LRGKEGGGRTESDGQGKLPAHVAVTGGRDEAAGGGVEGEEGGADDGVLVREVVPGCEAVGVEEGALPWGEGGDTDWGVAGAGDVGEGGEDDWRWRWGGGERESERAEDGDAEGEAMEHSLGREDASSVEGQWNREMRVC